MKVIVKHDKYDYKLKKRVFSHQYSEKWELVEDYCPKCGAKTLYVGDGDDYYLGRQYLCMSCEHCCYLDNGGGKTDDSDRQRIDQIREQRR